MGSSAWSPSASMTYCAIVATNFSPQATATAAMASIDAIECRSHPRTPPGRIAATIVLHQDM